MKHTTLPTKPGKYIDREGDEWTLNENFGWKCREICDGGSYSFAEKWLPFTDAPDDDKQTGADDRMLRINNPDDLKSGDLVYFHNDPTGYPFMTCRHGYIRVDIQGSGIPPWLDDALSGDVMVNGLYFDHAVREIEEPEWPDPHDSHLHIYLGSDGMRYIYNPVAESDMAPWTSEGYFASHSREGMEANYRDALPLTELELIPKERES